MIISKAEYILMKKYIKELEDKVNDQQKKIIELEKAQFNKRQELQIPVMF